MFILFWVKLINNKTFFLNVKCYALMSSYTFSSLFFFLRSSRKEKNWAIKNMHRTYEVVERKKEKQNVLFFFYWGHNRRDRISFYPFILYFSNYSVKCQNLEHVCVFARNHEFFLINFVKHTKKQPLILWANKWFSNDDKSEWDYLTDKR